MGVRWFSRVVRKFGGLPVVVCVCMWGGGGGGWGGVCGFD